MRITGGTLSGRTLQVPREGVRPTQDRVREALFASLAPRLPGARVLDLYAGTGALGLEAWSRGAADVVWVERDRRTFEYLERNVTALCVDGGSTQCLRMDVHRFLKRPPAGLGAFDLILADPPYLDDPGLEQLGNVLSAVRAHSMLTLGGLFAYELAGAGEGSFPGWREVRCRKYGRTRVLIFTRASSPQEDIRMNNHGIYAGTFDPMTLGHLDLVQRAAKIFVNLTVAVAREHVGKPSPLFTLEERIALVKEAVEPVGNVSVDEFDGLLVDYARAKGARLLVRGLRAFSDFEYEFQMALTNRRLAPDIETIFLMPKPDYSYVSSSVVREVAQFGGEITQFVPAHVAAAVERKYRG